MAAFWFMIYLMLGTGKPTQTARLKESTMLVTQSGPRVGPVNHVFCDDTSQTIHSNEAAY